MIAAPNASAQMFSRSELVTQSEDSRGMALADTDNDGDLDIIIGNAQTGTGFLRLFENDGSGGYALAWSAAAPAGAQGGVSSLAAGDFDNDGYVDIVVGLDGAGGLGNRPTAAVYRNNSGNDTFTLRWVNDVAQASGHNADGVKTADFDNDGLLEFAFVDKSVSAKTHVRVFQSTMSNASGFAEAYLSGLAFHGDDLVVGDLDNDGDPDMVAVADGTLADAAKDIYVFKNNGGFAFTNSWSSPNNTAFRRAALADFDSDGRLDLVVTGWGIASEIRRNTSASDLSFSSVLWRSSQTDNSFAVAVGDFDSGSGGRLDILVGNYNQASRVYRSTMTDGSGWVQEFVTFVSSAHRVAAGDLNGDNKLDFVFANGGDLTGSRAQVNHLFLSNVSQANSAPAAPSAGYSSSIASGTLSLKWDAGSDSETTDADGLYYAVRGGSSPQVGLNSANLLPAVYATPLLGSHLRPRLSDSQLGVTLTGPAAGLFYWQVAAIDSGLRRGAWGEEQVSNIPASYGIVPTAKHATADTTGDTSLAQIDTLEGGACPAAVNTSDGYWTADVDFNASLINFDTTTLTSAGVTSLAGATLSMTYCRESTYGGLANAVYVTTTSVDCIASPADSRCKNTGAVPDTAAAGVWVTKTFDLYSAGIQTPAQLVALKLSYDADDAGSAGGMSFDKIEVTVLDGTDLTPPNAVTNLAAANGGSNKITLNWTWPGDDGATGSVSSYVVRMATYCFGGTGYNGWPNVTDVNAYSPSAPSIQSAGNTVSVDVTGLTNGQPYYFAIKTRDDKDNISPIDSNTAGGCGTMATATPGGASLPPGPAAGPFKAVYSSSITAAWQQLTGVATGYTLAASINPSSPPSPIWASSDTTNVAATTATVHSPALAPNTTHYLFVRYSSANTISEWTAFPATSTLAMAPLTAPTTFLGVWNSSFTVAFSTNSNPINITTYTVHLSTASDFNLWATSVTFSTAPGGPSPTAALTGLSGGTTYYLRVRAVNHNGVPTDWTTLGSTVTGRPQLSEGYGFIAYEPATYGASANVYEGYGDVAWGDMNNDGYLDLAVAGWDGTARRLMVYIANSTGTFDSVVKPNGDNGPADGGLAWGDYDRDGDLDLAASGRDPGGTSRLRIYVNNSTGTFSGIIEPNGATGPGWKGALAWGDIDNDGDLDLAADGEVGASRVMRVYIANSTGTFSSVVEPQAANGLSNGALAWGDYDNDGDLDLLGAGWDNGVGQNRVRVYVNNSTGTFSQIVQPGGAAPNVGGGSAAWGDYDNDGDLDIVVGGHDGAYKLHVYPNNGNGTFAAAISPGGSPAPGWSGAAAWGDFDNDGDLDLAVNGIESDSPSPVYRLRVYVTNSTGTFSSVLEPAGAAGPGSGVAWGDMDGDGDLDLAVNGHDATQYRVVVYKNQLVENLGGWAANTTPSAPASGLDYSVEGTVYNRELKLKWNAGSDAQTTDPDGLYYAVRVSTKSMSAPADASVFSGALGSPLLGHYLRPKLSGGQLGVSLEGIVTGNVYWQVATVDSGLRLSAWSPEQTAVMTGCTYKRVKKSGAGADHSTIQAAIDAIPATLTSDYCIEVDSATYTEQVTIQNKDTQGYTINIYAEPGMASSTATLVIPPTGSTAAFHVMNASVTLSRINIRSSNVASWGVLVASPTVSISSVNVDGVSRLRYGGFQLSTGTTISFASATVRSAHAFYLTGSGASISYSTGLSAVATGYALYLNGSSAASISYSSFTSSVSYGVVIDSGASNNTISRSTMSSFGSGFPALYFRAASSNTATGSYVWSPSGYGARIDLVSDLNTISHSTAVSANASYAAVAIFGNSSSNTVSGSRLTNTPGYGLWIDQSHWNSFSRSTAIIGASAIPGAFYAWSASGTTLSDSYFQNTAGNAVVFDGGCRYGEVARSSAIAAGANAASVYIQDSSSHTVQDSFMSSPGGYALRINRSHWTDIYRSTGHNNSAGTPGTVYAFSSSGTFISDSYFQNLAGNVVVFDSGSHYGEVTRSSMVTSAGASAMYIWNSSSNTVQDSWMSAPSGYGLRVRSAHYNSVSRSTAASNIINFYGAYIFDSSGTALTDTYVTNGGWHGAYVDFSRYSQFLRSSFTATAGAGNYHGLILNAASSNTVVDGYMFSGSGRALRVYGSRYNTVQGSTVKGSLAGQPGLELVGAPWNTILQADISNPNGDAAYLDAGSSNTVIRFSTMTSGAATYAGLYTTVISSLTIEGCVFSNTSTGGGASPGYAVWLDSASHTSIIRSTMTAFIGLRMRRGYHSGLYDSYVHASSAAYISASTGVVVAGSVLVSSNPATSALWFTWGTRDVRVTSSTLVAGAAAHGLLTDPGGGERLDISSNVFFGGLSGLTISTMTVSPTVYIASNTILPFASTAQDTYGLRITGLSTGATIYNNSIFYRTPASASGRTTYGFRADTSDGLNVNRNRINNPGMITAGSFVAAQFANVTASTFSFNDVHSTGTALTDAFLLQLAGTPAASASTVTIRGNVFVASFTVTGSSASLHATAGSGLITDWNLWFSSTARNTFTWGRSYEFPWTSLAMDTNSVSGHPEWASTAAGAEDFHPRGTAFRYDPATQAAASPADTIDSPSIDAADLAEAWASEPAPNGRRANLGSYSNTSEASAAANFAGCGFTARVNKTRGPSLTIRMAQSLIPTTLAEDSCVVITDTSTYSERVTVQNYANNGYRIMFIGSASASRPAINAPTASTAGFHVMNASVTLLGLDTKSTNSVTYGVLVSSAYASISSMTLTPFSGGAINQAALRVSSWTTVAFVTATSGARGIWIEGVGSSLSDVSGDSSGGGSNSSGLYLYHASSTTLTRAAATASPASPAAVFSSAAYTTIRFSTFTGGTGWLADPGVSGTGALRLNFSSGTTIIGSVLTGGSGGNANTNSNGGWGGDALYAYGSSALLVDRSTLRGGDAGMGSGGGVGGTGGRAILLMADSSSVTITGATATGGSGAIGPGDNGLNAEGLYVQNSSSVTVLNSLLESSALGPGTGGSGATVENSSSFGLHDSTATAYGGVGFYVAGSSGVVVERSFISAEYGLSYGLQALNSLVLSISGSTMTALGDGLAGASLNLVSSVTIASCYVQGSTAVHVTASTAASVSGSVLVSSHTGSAAAYAQTSVGFSVSLSTALSLGGAGSGLFAERSGGLLAFTTNYIGGGYASGIHVATTALNASVFLSSNTVLPAPSTQRDIHGLRLEGLATGATVQHNSVLFRTPGSASGRTVYGLHVNTSKGALLRNNRFNLPGVLSAGSYVGAYFAAVTGSTFSYNDTHSSGTAFTNAYLVRLEASTVSFRGNVFASSFTVSGSSACLLASADSGFDSDYNDWFSSTSLNTLIWGGKGYAYPWAAAIAKDANSISAHPLWANTGISQEDFHPRSTGGRWTPSGFVTDGAHSQTIDAGDPSEAYSLETEDNGDRVNLGSYGNTAEASRSASAALAAPAPNSSVVHMSSITASWSLVAGATGYTLVASTKSANPPEIWASSMPVGQTATTATVFSPALDPNTTYFLFVRSEGPNASSAYAAFSATATLTKLLSGATTYEPFVTSMTVNWLPLALAPPDASSNSSSGYRLEVSSRSDFVPLWTSSVTPAVSLSTLTVDGLRGGVTYYFRVGGLNHNSVPHYGVAFSTVMPVVLGADFSTKTIVLPGLTQLNSSLNITTGTVLTNLGNVKQTYWIRATTMTAGSPWRVGAVPGIDRFSILGVVKPTQANTPDFGAEDGIVEGETACSSTAFAVGANTCVTVPAGETRTLWFRLFTPIVTSTGNAQDIRVTARAVKDPDPDPNP